jgi:hypothetical protein
MYVVLMLEPQSMPTMMLTYIYGRTRKSLGQELKLIKRDQDHQELREKYDFIGFSVRIDKRRTGNLKGMAESAKREEKTQMRTKEQQGVSSHTYQRMKIDRSRLLTGPCLSMFPSTPHSPVMQLSIVENKVDAKSKRTR